MHRCLLFFPYSFYFEKRKQTSWDFEIKVESCLITKTPFVKLYYTETTKYRNPKITAFLKKNKILLRVGKPNGETTERNCTNKMTRVECLQYASIH